MSSIEPLRGKWSVEAALIDAIDRVRGQTEPPIAMVAAWVNADGSVSWSKATYTAEQASTLAVFVMHQALSFWNDPKE